MSRSAARRRAVSVARRGPGGRRRHLEVPSRLLRAPVPVAVWSPPGVRSADPLPLVLAHDGPDYGDRTPLLSCAAAAGFRVALLSAPGREDWYSASAVYARALATEIVPAVGEVGAVRERPIGIGASLGGLAMLQAQRRHPGLFAGLLLQSGSYFVPRFDAHESGFERYQRITRFVRGTLRAAEHPDPCPLVITCGADEENLDNNRLMADALQRQGYALEFDVLPGGHDWESWAVGVERWMPRLAQSAWNLGAAEPA